jgi:hypothetical protein
MHTYVVHGDVKYRVAAKVKVRRRGADGSGVPTSIAGIGERACMAVVA